MLSIKNNGGEVKCASQLHAICVFIAVYVATKFFLDSISKIVDRNRVIPDTGIGQTEMFLCILQVMYKYLPKNFCFHLEKQANYPIRIIIKHDELELVRGFVIELPIQKKQIKKRILKEIKVLQILEKRTTSQLLAPKGASL